MTISPDSPPSKWLRRQPKPVKPQRRRWPSIIAVTVLVMAFTAAALWYSTKENRLQPPPTLPVPAPPVLPERAVSLFFPLSNGNGLAGVIRKRPGCPDEESCIQDLLAALSENPGAGLFPLFPPQSNIRLTDRTGPVAIINFSQKTIQHITGGVLNERLILTALIDTLSVNYPQVQSLLIQIDGLPADTLKGHVDMRQPFPADFSFVRTTQQTLPEIPGPSTDRSQKP